MTTIEMINKATRQPTLHPMICVVSGEHDATARCAINHTDFYALTIAHHKGGETLHLLTPGEHMNGQMEQGVYFHPDLLCDTPLEAHIAEFPPKCKCHNDLSTDELKFINGCFVKIREELSHPIDRYSATILASHLNLLLNYCVKICNLTTK